MAELLASLTKDSFVALNGAKDIANHLDQTIVTPYELLLAILDPPGSMGEAVLKQFPIRMDQLITRLRATIRIDAGEDETWVSPGYQDKRYTLSSETTAIIEAANHEALDQGIDYVDTRVLILGMLRSPQTSAGEILKQFGITLQDYREKAALTVIPPQVSAQPKPSRVSSTVLPKSPVSPIFIILLLVMGISGYMLFSHIGNANMIVFLFVIVGWLVALSLHEFGHSIVAYIGGDHSVAEKGYLTLDPLKYTHPLLSIIFPIVFLLMGGIPLPGGAVYINTHAIRTRLMRSLTSAAGPIATLLFGLLLLIPFILGWYEADLVQHMAFWSALALLAFLQIFALILNLIPFPGLDGFGILEPYLPEGVLRLAYMIRPFSLILFFVLIFSTSMGQRLTEEVANVMNWIGGEQVMWLVGNGFDMFQFWQ